MKPDISQVRRLCRSFRLTPDQEYGFCEYIHDCKESGDGGSDGGDFTYTELEALLREFLDAEGHGNDGD